MDINEKINKVLALIKDQVDLLNQGGIKKLDFEIYAEHIKTTGIAERDFCYVLKNLEQRQIIKIIEIYNYDDRIIGIEEITDIGINGVKIAVEVKKLNEELDQITIDHAKDNITGLNFKKGSHKTNKENVETIEILKTKPIKVYINKDYNCPILPNINIRGGGYRSVGQCNNKFS